MWALLLPRLCARAELGEELLALARDPKTALEVLDGTPSSAP